MKILTVATAWGSRHGGVNVFNYRLCRGLVACGHEVACYVKKYTSADLSDAHSHNIALMQIDKPSDTHWSTEDVGHVAYDDLGIYDAIIVHDIIAKAFADHLPSHANRPTIVSFIHTLYRDTDYIGDLSDDKRRERTETQFALIEQSDLVFTSGGWITAQLIEERPALKNKITPFMPGRLDINPCGGCSEGSITTLGRLSLANDKKQASSILTAYTKMAQGWGRDAATGSKLPNLVLVGVNCDVEVQQTLKKDLQEASGWAGRVEFLSFKDYYDFSTSDILKVLRTSKVILTPSIVESFGLASLEASCLGIPLIASYRSGFHFDLKKTVKEIPEFGIEWLDVSDFDDLPGNLMIRLRQILQRYETYRRGAMVLAEYILAAWPTWPHSCQALCGAITTFRMAAPKSTLLHTLETSVGDSPFAKLKSVILSTTTANIGAPNSDDDAADGVISVAPGSRSSSLRQLAELCYCANLIPGSSLKSAVAERFSDKTCTPLQEQIASALSSHGLHRFQDILLCGGTSSGKTTAAELLFGRANDTDFTTARILYLAPTRALAQERWRDWSSCFQHLTLSRCHDNVIVSTGEDHSSDRALARGEFLIACLVFEKANVILSASPELVKRLTMIVVDELHMIADIHRGPIIETLLAKVKYEKRRRQKRDDIQFPLRIVGITTEQSTVEAFDRYFTNLDRETDENIPPIVAIDVGRPA